MSKLVSVYAVIIGLLALTCAVANYGCFEYDCVKLKDYISFTAKKNGMTASKKGKPYPQLNCVGGDACDYSDYVKHITCTNIGFDYDSSSIKWHCLANNGNLDKRFALTQTDISCESYYPAGGYVLRNSCLVNYKLNKTNYFYTQNSSMDGYYGLMLYFTCIVPILGITIFAALKYSSNYHNENIYRRGYHSNFASQTDETGTFHTGPLYVTRTNIATVNPTLSHEKSCHPEDIINQESTGSCIRKRCISERDTSCTITTPSVSVQQSKTVSFSPTSMCYKCDDNASSEGVTEIRTEDIDQKVQTDETRQQTSQATEEKNITNAVATGLTAVRTEETSVSQEEETAEDDNTNAVSTGLTSLR